MAVNTQKFLPSSKGGALAKVKKITVKSSSIVSLSEKSLQDIGVIRVKVIEVDSLLRGTLASEKKKLNEAKKQESSKRREKLEEKLETKPKAEKGKITMPKFPKMGFLDWIKNFIGNIILGYFAVRLVDHLPKIIPIIKFLGKATDFILDIGGKLLNGLVTFVDWGYKAIDATRGMVGKTFGDDALKNFDKLASEFEKFINIAIIVGMASADFGMDRLGRRGAEKASKKGAGTLARRGAGRTLTRAGARLGGKGGAKLASKFGSKALKAVPLLGAGLAITEGIMRIKSGDYVGGLLSFGTAIPVAGWAFLALDIAREFMGGKEFDKNIGRAFGGKPGVSDKQVQKRTPYFSGPSFMGVAGGGITRGGKSQGGVKRSVSKGKGGSKKYKRKVTTKKPREDSDIKPGSDIGGEEKLFGIFPKPKLPDFMNPFNIIFNAGKNLGKSDYFGPILSITSKIILGQKPTQRDYENVGLGINLLISKGISDGKLKGGLAAAFAEGGFVDPKALDAISEGGDVSNWISKAFKDATETNAQKTLREIQENLRLKKEGGGPAGSPTEDQMPPGTGSLVGNTNAEKVFNYLIGYGFTEQAAAGVIGNLMQESGVNPQSRQLGGGPGRGIMQWGTGPGSGGRWDALVAWAASSGKDPWKLDTQVEWMMKEMRSYGTLNRLKGVTDVKKAVEIFEREMEKAGTPNYPRRYQFAADALTSFGKGRSGRMGGGMDRGGVGGAVAEYITGDPNTPFGRFDRAGHGSPSNYHDHIAFRDRATAVRAYNFFKSKGIQVTEFQGFNPVGGHASGSYHYSGLAFDIPGAQWGGSGAIGAKDYAGSARVRKTLKEFLGGGGLVTMAKGGRVGGPTKALIGERGEEFVIDADTTQGLDSLAPGLVEKLNMAKSKPQIANILQSYASYESGSEQTVVVEDATPNMTFSGYESQSSGGGLPFFDDGEGDDPFDVLYQGG